MQNSPFSELLLQIQARIISEVESINHIDEDKGQLDKGRGRPPVLFPCLLVDFNILRITDQGDGIQDVQLDVLLRMGFPACGSAASWLPKDVIADALTYFDIEYQVYLALHTWLPDGFSTFLHRSAKTEKRDDNLRVRELHYETEYREISHRPARTSISKPHVEVETQLQSQPGTEE